MSDDEYYADSPYDEFEEMLWDADPAPNLADDLAQHAAHSPVWHDDPTGELDAYHSDWDYYSDDYYDDDPVILRDNPVDGSSPRMKSTKKTMAGRGKKRKVDDLGVIDKSFEPIETRALRRSIRGTVWAKHISPTTTIFRDGQLEKVALLTDWQDRFSFNNPKGQSDGKTQLGRDESWANDLSLADMGLMHVRDRKGTQQEVSVEDNETYNEESDNALVDVDGTDSHESGTWSDLTPQDPSQCDNSDELPSNGDRSSAQIVHDPETRKLQIEVEGNPRASKRAKTTHVASPVTQQSTTMEGQGSKRIVENQLDDTDTEHGTEHNRTKRTRNASIHPLESGGQMIRTENGRTKRKTKRKRSLSTDDDASPSSSTPPETTKPKRPKRTPSARLGGQTDHIPRTQTRVTNIRPVGAYKK